MGAKHLKPPITQQNQILTEQGLCIFGYIDFKPNKETTSTHTHTPTSKLDEKKNEQVSQSHARTSSKKQKRKDEQAGTKGPIISISKQTEEE